MQCFLLGELGLIKMKYLIQTFIYFVFLSTSFNTNFKLLVWFILFTFFLRGNFKKKVFFIDKKGKRGKETSNILIQVKFYFRLFDTVVETFYLSTRRYIFYI